MAKSPSSRGAKGPPSIDAAPIVQIVGPTDNWILEKLARTLAAKLPYAVFSPWRVDPQKGGHLAYYVNYALHGSPSGMLDIGFFTHEEEGNQFLDRAHRMDGCVCMAKQYADRLLSLGVKNVYHVPMGCDAARFRLRLVLGVVAQMEHPRKGRHLLEQLGQLPFVELRMTEGRLGEDQLREFYQQLDYVLIPATVEGGPMSLLEGLAVGKPIIAPDSVGIVPEFPVSPYIRRYTTGDIASLTQVVAACYQEKLDRAALVYGRTFDDWAEGHHRLFTRLLQERGTPIPSPAPGFRFGLLRELDLPPVADITGLEPILDDVARHLYFGQYQPARAILQSLEPQVPQVQTILKTLPNK